MGYNRALGATIRDFAKSQPGKKFLAEHFDFSAFPRPQALQAADTPSALDPNILGEAVDQMILLLVERANRGSMIEKHLPDRSVDCTNTARKAIEHYLATGELRDALLDFLVRSALKGRRIYVEKGIQKRGISFVSFRPVLRAIHDVALRLDWSSKRLLFSRHVTGTSRFASRVDLVLDSTLIEIKATKDTQHHSEHVAQLLAYFLASQAPVQKPRELEIEKLGIYYAKHGVLETCKIRTLSRFPTPRLKRIAFDFLAEFQCWRDLRDFGSVSEDIKEEIQSRALHSVLMEVRPKPAWYVQLQEEAREMADRGAKSKVSVPQEFLIDEPT